MLSINLLTFTEVSAFDGDQNSVGYFTSALSVDGRTLYLASRKSNGDGESILSKLSLPRMLQYSEIISNIASCVPLGLLWQRNMLLYPVYL